MVHWLLLPTDSPRREIGFQFVSEEYSLFSLLDFQESDDYGGAIIRQKASEREKARKALMIGFKRISTWQFRFWCLCAICTYSPIHNYSIILHHHRQESRQFMASRIADNWIVCYRLIERPSHNSLRQQEWPRYCGAFCAVHYCVSSALFPDNRVFFYLYLVCHFIGSLARLT